MAKKSKKTKKFGSNVSSTSKKTIWTALVISWIIIGVGVWRVFWGSGATLGGSGGTGGAGGIGGASGGGGTGTEAGSTTGASDTNEDSQNGRYYIDQQVILDGTLSRTEGFKQYTHDFISKNNTNFGIKSADIDLYTYSGNTQLKGVVVDIVDGLPIIRVSEIVDLERSAGNTNTDSSDTYSYFKNAGLGIDLENTNGYAVKQQDNEIIIVDTVEEGSPAVLSIAPFTCTPGDGLKDCISLKTTFENTNAESFISSNNIKFTNLTETNTRLMFDSTNRGYYVKPKGQKELTTFVDMVHFVNEDILGSEVDDQAQQDCKNIEHRFGTQTSTTITDKNNGTLEAIITGTSASDDLVTLTCTYEIALGSTRSLSLADISVVTSASDEKKQEEAIEPETNEVEAEAKVEVEEETEAEEGREDEVDEANEIGVDEGSGDQGSPDEAIIDEVEAPIEEETIEIEQEEPSPTPGTYADRLSFSSSRGYTMYFSDKGIAYAGAYMTGDAIMNIGGVNCTYGTKVIKRANADSVNTNPDSIIYECVTDGDINTASLPNNTTYIGERGDVHFIKKDFTSALSDMEVGVVR